MEIAKSGAESRGINSYEGYVTDQQNPTRGYVIMIFNHVQLKVKNLNISRSFYDAVMNELGYGVVLEIPGTVIGYGTSTHDMFELRQSDENASLSHSVHIAFNASSKAGVDRFHRTSISNGGECNGVPGFRPQYESDYYAAFVIDPDGHNIEAVCKIGPDN